MYIVYLGSRLRVQFAHVSTVACSGLFFRNFQESFGKFLDNFSFPKNFFIISLLFLLNFSLLDNFQAVSQLFLTSRKFLNFLVTLVDEIAMLKINLCMYIQLSWTGILH